MAAIGKEQEQIAIQKVCESYWYKKIMIEDMPCSDYWQMEND